MKNSFIALYVLAIFTQPIYSGEPISDNSKSIVEDIRSHNQGIAIWWTGHNGWLIKSGDILIGTDLVLESDEREISSPISANELAELIDISFITHEHGDHFERETSRILAENGECLL